MASPLQSSQEGFDILQEAILKAKYEGTNGSGVDAASGLIYDGKKAMYMLGHGDLTRDDLIAYYEELTHKLPIIFLEGGLWLLSKLLVYLRLS